MKSLNELAKTAYENALDHGFYDKATTIPERLCLIHSEISEALEANRDGVVHMVIGTNGKPFGLATELADAIIRILDMCHWLNIDIQGCVDTKMSYNRSRPYLHGRVNP